VFGRVGALVLVGGSTACGPAAPEARAVVPHVDPPAVTVAAVAPTGPAASASSLAPRERAAAPRGIWLEPVPAAAPPLAAPAVELLAPFAGTVIPASAAASSRVRVAVTGSSFAAAGGRVAVTLDGDVPRILGEMPAEIPLGDLPSDGRPVGPGRHRLIAVAVDAGGIAYRVPPRASRGPVAVVDFFVGERGALPPDAPFIVVLSPPADGATAVDAILIDCVAVGASLATGEARLVIEITGPSDRWRAELGDDAPRRLRGLHPGEHALELALVTGEGPVRRVLDRVRRVVVVGEAAAAGGLSPSVPDGAEP